MDGTFLLPGQSPGMPPRCPPTEAQLERAPWPPSVVAQETFPRSPSEHSATKLDSLRSQSLRPEPAPGPVLVGDQPDPDPGLQDFSKDGYKAAHLSKCVCGGGGEGLSGIRLQSRWGTSCSRAQGPSEKGNRCERVHVVSGLCQPLPQHLSSLLLQRTLSFQEGGGWATGTAPPQGSVPSGRSRARAGLRRPQL